MSERMRQELSGVKNEVAGLAIRLGDVETRLTGVETRLTGVETRLAGVEARLTGVEKRLDVLEVKVHNISVVVAGHTEAFVRVEKKLEKLDSLDGIMKGLEMFTSEIIASRNERALMGKSFWDHHETLTNHELRLTRLELDRKQS